LRKVVLPAQQLQGRLGLAQAAAHSLGLFLADLATGQVQLPRPGLALGQLDARPEGHVHLDQGQLQRHPVRDAHALEFEVAVAVHDVLQVTLRGPPQVGGQGLRLARQRGRPVGLCRRRFTSPEPAGVSPILPFIGLPYFCQQIVPEIVHAAVFEQPVDQILLAVIVGQIGQEGMEGRAILAEAPQPFGGEGIAQQSPNSAEVVFFRCGRR
jgi:hypothetical protein